MTLREDEKRVRQSYEEVPYPSALQHHTHPDHLATIALLHGVEAAPPERCRVLELGCADGGNIIPMALEFPESRFTGIDLSPRQIGSGRARAASLGLTNIDLRTLSILDVTPGYGTFDYVICHGVFSWVSREVQERILAVCRDVLAPHGVAYVSYNTLPGWHLRRMVRDMVQFHARGTADLAARSAKAYELIDFLGATQPATANDAHAIFLRSTREHFDEYRDRPSYVVHEYLEETNAPLYFHEMVGRAAAHGLQYLAEAEPYTSEVDNLPPAIATQLRAWAGDRIELEQYVDFVVNRAFRRTLFCHAGVTLDRELQLERMRRFHVTSLARADAEEVDLRPGRPAPFRTEREKSFTSDHAAAKGVLVALQAIAPGAASFDALLADVTSRLAKVDAAAQIDKGVLADLLYALYWNGVVELHLIAPQVTNTISRHPRATELARRQATAGLLVTNQRRRVLKLDDPFARFLLRHLDGQNDRQALVRLLDREVSAGRLEVSVNGEQVRQPERIPSVLQALVDHHLKKMAEYALLVA